jgi:hypothetical protein
MITISGRHTLPAIVALWLLAIPIGYHALARPRVDDCADPARLGVPDFLPRSAGVNPHPDEARMEVITWNDGELLTDRPWKTNPRWRIVRAYDLAKFYFAPPGTFTYVSPEDTVSVVVREANGVDLPIHVRVYDSGKSSNVTAYLYVFGGRPVRRPFVASLENAIRQLAGGALPLTLIVVEGDSTTEHAQENEEFLIDWIRSAWIELDAVCGS